MASFGMWKETSINLVTGLNTINLDPATNILKIINEDMLGSVLYMSTKSDVSPDRFEEKIERGSSTSLVRTRSLGTAYIFSPKPVSVTMIEIETDDISFIFNASNQVQISGVLESNGLKPTDLKREGDNTLNTVDKTLAAKLDTLITLITESNVILNKIDTNTKTV